jgi:hypothetical protein
MTQDLMSDHRTTSWNDLSDQLYAGSWQESLGRFRSRWVYRGAGRAEHDLRSGLARLAGPAQPLEEYILRAFQRYAYRGGQADMSIWNWLALAQHHGLATRLLDWTYSPLVAMHFATENLRAYDADGIIWCLDHGRTNAFLPEQLKELLTREGSDVFTVGMLDQAAGSLHDFDALSQEPFVAFFEPPSLDERIVNQYALFSLASDPVLDLACWLREHPDAYRRIIIPAELKQEIRDKLDQANVTERVLYPGLDGLCQWLNRYYRPRRDGNHEP